MGGVEVFRTKFGVLALYMVGLASSAMGNQEAGRAQSPASNVAPMARAEQIYSRVAGQVLNRLHPRYHEIQGLAQQERFADIARIATQEESFLRATVWSWASKILSNQENANLALNDTIATLIGSVRENYDARRLLTEPLIFAPRPPSQAYSLDSNSTYEIFERSRLSLRDRLIPVSPQWDIGQFPLEKQAGILTTRGWAEEYYSGGTNRRAVVGALRGFLCQPMDSWKDASLPPYRIRQDVSRRPREDPAAFRNECRSCHAPMDALAGAFAFFDFEGGVLSASQKVQGKYTIHTNQSPDEGYETGEYDDSWVNLLLDSRHNTKLGFKGPSRRHGVRELGQALAESEAFPSCMVQRVRSEVCDPSQGPGQAGDPVFDGLVRGFKADHYRLGNLFVAVATAPGCIGGEKVKARNFRNLPSSLESATRVPDRSMRAFEFFERSSTKFPKIGLLEEISGLSVLTLLNYSGQFCEEMVRRDAVVPDPVKRRIHTSIDFKGGVDQLLRAPGNLVLDTYAELFWQRELNSQERELYDEFIRGLKSENTEIRPALLALCTSFLTSPAFVFH